MNKELYIKGLLEIEGRKLSVKSKELILKSIEAEINISRVIQIGQTLLRYDLDNQAMPELWSLIAQKVLYYRGGDHKDGSLSMRAALVLLADSGYADPEVWETLKTNIISNAQGMDLASIITLRNAY